MKSPFKFLDAFELRDRAEFFGRDEEIDQLYRMVNKNRLVLVYGQSGTGKTSLVQCGLASRYDATDWLPVFVRRGAGMMASFAEALGKVLNRTLTSVTPADIDAAYAIYLRPLYLIFDQFEELFILGSLEEQQQFVEMIATLHQAELPCRILFIIREEYLGALYNFEKTMPTLFDRRLRVEPMSAVKVAAVLSQSFERFHISLEAPAQNLSQIIEKVSEKRAGVQLPYLQVYLDLFWQEDFGRTYPQGAPAGDGYPALEFDTREIEAFGEIGDVLGRFLARQRRELQDRLATLLPGAAGTEINRLLDVFVTEEGTKRPVTLERRGDEVTLGNVPAAALDDIPNPLLFAGLDLLERSRLLRVAGNQAELAHDALAALIDRERSAEQRQRNEVNQRLRHAWREYQLTGGQDYHPSEKLVLDTGALLEQLRLPPELLQFYEMSRRAVEDRKHD
ncbi:MAG: ATP-binding protein, partial [Saprospiraceae bacterium]